MSIERFFPIALALLVASCATREPADGPPDRPTGAVTAPDAVPRPEARSKYGNHSPYKVNGKSYHVMPSSSGYSERGVASWYGKKFHGRKTSSGEVYDMYAMTAAHKSLPLPTYVEVTNLDNGRSAVFKVNDRGPFVHNRIIDLSYAGASKLGMVGTGTAFVEVRAIDTGTPVTQKNRQNRHIPEPVATDAPEPEQRLFVQVGAFAEYRNAIRMQQRLLDEGFASTQLAEAGIDGRSIYRVRVGPVSSVDSYDKLINRLARAGITETHLVDGD